MNKHLNTEKFESVKDLSQIELTAINGGSGFWKDLMSVIAATVHFVGYMIVDAHNNPIRPSEYR